MLAFREKRDEKKPISSFSKKDVEELIEKYGPSVIGITMYIIAITMLATMLTAFVASCIFVMLFLLTGHPLYLTSSIIAACFVAFPFSVAYSVLNWKALKRKFKD